MQVKHICAPQKRALFLQIGKANAFFDRNLKKSGKKYYKIITENQTAVLSNLTKL